MLLRYRIRVLHHDLEQASPNLQMLKDENRTLHLPEVDNTVHLFVGHHTHKQGHNPLFKQSDDFVVLDQRLFRQLKNEVREVEQDAASVG